MKTSQWNLSVLAALSLTLMTSAHADTDVTVESGTSSAKADVSRRSEKKLGAYMGILGDPAPTLVGVNLAYNLKDYLRVSAGYGEVTQTGYSYDGNTGTLSSETTGKLQTFGVGARAMMPGWNFSPVVGLSAGYMKLSGSLRNVQGLEKSGVNAYGTLGFDYQARSGFNLAAGYNFPLGNSMESNPYLNLGWFFDLGV